MTLANLRSIIKTEAAGTGAGVSVSDPEIDSMLNDTYIEWVLHSKCILNTITTNWTQGPYLDITTISGIVNPYKPISILNNINNLYLSDEGCRDIFDNLRIDWETWDGIPVYWDFIDLKRLCFAPHLVNPYGSFTMQYNSYPTKLVNDSDVPVIASDVHLELVKGTVFRYLESLEEFSKAKTWEIDHIVAMDKYKDRVQDLSQRPPRIQG